MSYHSDLDFIELKHGVNIDISDEDGMTHVYSYTDAGDRVGFDFESMNPDLTDIMVVAQGIDNIRTIANKSPRVGRPTGVR